MCSSLTFHILFVGDMSHHGHNCRVLTTNCAISGYHHYSCEFESHSLQGVLDTTLYDKVCQ